VRQIVERHCGDIRLLPRDGGGICARVDLPTVPPQEASGILVPHSLPAETA
jgi:signal transduction histidine kinase